MKKKREIKKKRKIEKRIIKRQIDVLWLVLIVMGLIIFISMFTQESDLEGAENLKMEAENILNKLTADGEYSFAQDDVIHEERLEKILNMAYSEFKNNLNVKNDFCIYFEDEDGNLVEVKDGVKSIGSSAIEINGEPCGQ